MTRARCFVFAAAGGAIYFLGFVGHGIWPLLFVFLVPLWWALDAEQSRGAGFAAALGLAFGAAAYAGGFPWLWRITDVFLGGNVALGAAVWLAYGVWFASAFVVYAVAFRRLRGRQWPPAVAGIAPLVAIEWLQPQLLPVHAGSGLLAAPALVQAADLGGPLLLTGLVVAMNAVAYASVAWLQGRHGRPLGAWAAGIVLISLAVGYAALRSRAVEAAVSSAPGLEVGIVQANLGLLEKRTQGIVGHARHLEQTRELLTTGPLDLVVWPETAYVRGLRRPLPISGALVREDIETPLLFGATSVWEKDGRRRKSNSVFLIGADGEIRDGYDKNLLIPLAEYVPFESLAPQLAALFPNLQEFQGSNEVPALRLGGWRVSTPICFEVLRQELVRRMVREADPHLLVTLANDAWFGDSEAPWLHLDLARLRAVEHRRYLVRATNSGVSAIIDPLGRIVAQTGLLTRENLRGSVRPLAIRTPYTWLGDWPGPLAFAVTAAALVTRPRRRPQANSNGES